MKFLLIAALAMLSMTTSVLAATESGPVKVTACIVNGPGTVNTTVMIPNVSLTQGVTVTLVNTSDKTATAVTVTGSYHGRVVTDTAKFDFKPGTTAQISRRYTPSVFIDTDAECHVVHVQFADGTSWSLPGAH
jgi:hypothetical protein